MSIKITFHNMDHSDLLEQHIHQKLERVIDLLKDEALSTPFLLEFWLKASHQHPSHSVEFHLRTKNFNINAHENGPDMYVAIDDTIDTMFKLIRKEKEKILDRQHKHDTEKNLFTKE